MFFYVYFPFYTLSTFEHITEQTLKKIHQSSYTEYKHICFGFDIEWVFGYAFPRFSLFFFFLPDVTVHTYLRKYWFFIHITQTQKGASKTAYTRMLVASLILLLHFQLFASFMAIRLRSYDSISIHSDAQDER